MSRGILVRLVLATILTTSAATGTARAEMVRVKSAHTVAATTDRLAKIVAARGLRVFARIDHAAGARKAGLRLRPMVLLLFGNPKLGTPLLQAAPTMGLDLPLKMLIWQDRSGTVWVGYDLTHRLARGRGLKPGHPVVMRITRTLAAFARAAAAK